MPLIAEEPALDADTVERDVADLLYQNGIGAPALNVVAGAFMVAVMPSVRAHSPLLLAIWLGAQFLIAALRALDIAKSTARRRVPGWSGRAETVRFGTGVVLSAIVWAAFPLLFFQQLDPTELAIMGIIPCALAGGSAAILGASPPLAILFGAFLLLPGALIFLFTPGGENELLGIGGVLFFGFVVLSTGVTNRGTMAAIATMRANQRLQSALRDTLDTLEERIKERTADLEYEVREREKYGIELARMAMHDPLTGLYNRNTLARKLFDELADAHAAGDRVAVLFLDLDKFKNVNDLHGHHAGDQVLREIVKRLRANVPHESMLARWGGDEFVFAQRVSFGIEGVEIAERLRRAISAPIGIGAETVIVGASAGIAVYPEHGESADDLIQAADIAMYAAKQEGRGRIRAFDRTMASVLGRRHELENALGEAIARNELWLEYQPVVDVAACRCTSLEALLRWDAPGFGVVAPAEFIPLAERTGEIQAIGRWVLDEACLAAANWPGIAPPAVSVNVSVAQIASGTLLDDVRAALEQSGLPASRLQIEVTETLFASEHAQTTPTLKALRAMGVRIALDDFGTGFSSLSYLGSLPIDTLKIDKSFIAGVEQRSRAIVEAIQSLARAFDLNVVAEGVETAEQAALLTSIGIPAFQGHFFSRPVPPESVPTATHAATEALATLR